nr:cell division protein [Cyanidium sp. THAL103]
MKNLWRSIIFIFFPALLILLIWRDFFHPFSQGLENNIVTSRMTYGRLIEYIRSGWVQCIDFYDNGRVAIVQALSPEMGDKLQFIRVEIPARSSDLIEELKRYSISFDAHADMISNIPILTILTNIVLPLILILGLIFFVRRSSNLSNSGGQISNFGKSKARFQMEAKTGISFDDVAGIEEAKDDFQEVVTFLKNPEKFLAVGATIPKGILLVGPPGTGKTLLARAIAGEASVPFFSISGSEFVEMFVGVGASRVRDLFKKAKENAPSIVFIDEIDAVGRQRGAGIGGGNDEREQTLNQLLTEMDGFQGNTGVIVIAATNRSDILDSALLRPGRFDRQVNISIPDINGRLAILKVHSKKKKMSKNILLETIARRTPGFSGADLSNLLNEAAILSVRRSKKEITFKEIDLAIDRVIAGMEGNPLVNNKIKRLIAYHEIGHAITATLLKDHDPVQKLSLIPRGQAKGLTWFTPMEDQMLISRAQILARITSALAGRAAEEIVFGFPEITTGAGNDLQLVTSLARQMVTRFGMSNIGPVSLETSNNEIFLGRDLGNRSDFSENITSRIDSQIASIVKNCYIQAISIIKINRAIIDKLVDILIEQETIDGDEFRKIVSEFTQLPLIAINFI